MFLSGVLHLCEMDWGNKSCNFSGGRYSSRNDLHRLSYSFLSM